MTSKTITINGQTSSLSFGQVKAKFMAEFEAHAEHIRSIMTPEQRKQHPAETLVAAYVDALHRTYTQYTQRQKVSFEASIRSRVSHQDYKALGYWPNELGSELND